MPRDHLETPRLWLRPFTLVDLDALAQINADPEVMRHTGNGQTVSRAETEFRLRSYIRHHREHGFGLWAAIDKQDRILTGFCGLQFVQGHNEIEIGFRLGKQYWERGLATEAAAASIGYGFDVLKLDRVIGLTRRENIASQRVLTKVGMRYFRDAWYYDALLMCYAIERQDCPSFTNKDTRGRISNGAANQPK
jgi:RimJ/RimL family protein N-acetyltransferase